MKPPGRRCSAGPARAQDHETLNPRVFEWPSAVLMLGPRGWRFRDDSVVAPVQQTINLMR